MYLDDIVIYGSNLKEHNKRLVEIFSKLREHKLKLQPDKYEFLRKEVIYLGHIITEDGIRPDPSKLHAVKNFPTPKRRAIFFRISRILSKIFRKFFKNSQTFDQINKKRGKI